MHLAIRVQIRRDTASKWQSANPILLAGELGIEQDTSKWKIGNGIDPWTTRPYVTQGIKGDPGRAFVYDDFTQPQLDALRQGIMTMAQGELSTLIDNTTLTVNDLVSDVSTAVDTANQTNQAMLTAEQLRESQEADRLVAENTRATFYTGYRDSLDLLQGSKANVADVYKKTETYKKSEVDASLSALTTDVNAQLAEIEQEVTEIKGALKHIKLESWADVQKAVRDGSHKNIVTVGDSFVAKYGGVDYTWDVIGINHDVPADSNYTNSLTIQSRDCLMNCVFDASEPTNPDGNIQQYGNNNYKNSNVRQWLNSSDAQFNFVKQHEFDEVLATAPYTGAGFLHNLDPELREVIGPVKKQVAKNTITDGGGQDTFVDTVFLLSRVEVYGGTEGDSTGEKPYEYYSVLAPTATTGELTGRIKYLSGSPRIWWFRSPHVGSSSHLRYVYALGGIGYGYAHHAYGLTPACTIY